MSRSSTSPTGATGALSASEIGVVRGTVTILHDVTLTVSPGDRVAVVGPNGVGKTTLLRILAGEITPDTGAVVRRPRSASVVHVPQESTVVAGETLSEHLARRTGVAEREAAMNAAAEALAAGRRGAGDAYSDALESWLTAGGADFAERASAVCARLGLEVDVLSRGAGALSGGQAARVRLAVVGLTRADVLLLDEPTNDLDLDGLAQLEEIVVNTPSGVVLVSHDREFLALTVTRVLEIDEFSRQSTVYSGGWRAYLDERGLAAARAQQAYGEYADKRDELTERARRQREWAREGARRSSNPAAEQDKHIRYRETQRAQKTGAKAVITESALQRLDAVEEPRTPWELRLSIASAGRGSEVVFALRGAVAARGDVRLGPIDLSVNAGERIRLIGPNGSGKTTLLDAMLGRLPLLAGESYVGPGVVIGELDQTRRDLRGAGSLLDVFQSLSGLSPVEARTLLAKFRIGADVVLRGADTLSPGERTRAGLALFQARGVTCLVLDEPTNHLDLPAIEQLEQALSSYDGTLLLVTHDRRLAEAVEITREIDVVSLASGVPSD